MRTFRERVEESHGLKYIRVKSGRVMWFRDALSDAKGAHTRLGRAVSRAFGLVNDDDDLERAWSGSSTTSPPTSPRSASRSTSAAA